MSLLSFALTFLKKFVGRTTSLQNKWSVDVNNGNLMEDIMDHDSEKVFTEEREVNISVEVVQEETIVCHADVESGFDVSRVDGSQEDARQSSNENTPSQMVSHMLFLIEMIAFFHKKCWVQ